MQLDTGQSMIPWNCAISATSSPSRTRATSPARPRSSTCSSRRSASRSARSSARSTRRCSCAIRAASALTDAGRSFLADAEAILADGRARRRPAPAAPRAARSAASPWASPPRRRSIRWSRAPSASSAATRPDVSFVLEESSSGDLLGGLRDERLDIAFIRSGLVDPQGLTVHALLQEDMAAALPARHRLARRPQPHAEGSRRRELHPLPPARRARPLRRHHRGLRRGGLQPACRPGGAAHRLDPQPRGGGPRHHHRAGVAEPPAAGRCNLPPAQRAAGDQGAAQPRLPPRRTLGRDAWPSSSWCARLRHETDQDHRPFQPSDRALRRAAEGGRRRACWSTCAPRPGRAASRSSAASGSPRASPRRASPMRCEGEALGGKPKAAAATTIWPRGPSSRRRSTALIAERADTTLCLMCAEKEPLDCHRTVLVSRRLAERGVRDRASAGRRHGQAARRDRRGAC